MTFAETVLPSSPTARALIIAIASLAILAAVWILQGLGYQPCELCLTQRYTFYAAAPFALLTAFAASRSADGLARGGFALLAAAFLANAALAAYHVGVEYRWWAGPTACTGGLTGSLNVRDLAKALDSVKVVRCDEVQLRIAGLSLAGWNVLASAALAIYAGLAARL
ncbi:MAG TPA: disulfide bond formation protein B [Roseiarcus sp.]|jgi:disulfide bond formation protein DsbB